LVGFTGTRMLEFFESDPFVAKMNAFEAAVNEKFERFFGTTNKHIRLTTKKLLVPVVSA